MNENLRNTSNEEFPLLIQIKNEECTIANDESCGAVSRTGYDESNGLGRTADKHEKIHVISPCNIQNISPDENDVPSHVPYEKSLRNNPLLSSSTITSIPRRSFIVTPRRPQHQTLTPRRSSMETPKLSFFQSTTRRRHSSVDGNLQSTPRTSSSFPSVKGTMTPPPSPLLSKKPSAPSLSNLSPLIDSLRNRFSHSPMNMTPHNLGDAENGGGVELLVSSQTTPSRWRAKQEKIIILRDVDEVIPCFESFHTNLRRHLSRRGVEVLPAFKTIPLTKTLSPNFSISISSSSTSGSLGDCSIHSLQDEENEHTRKMELHHPYGIPHVKSIDSFRRIAYEFQRRWSFVTGDTDSYSKDTPVGCLSIGMLSMDDSDCETSVSKNTEGDNNVQKNSSEKFLPYEVMTRELYDDNIVKDEAKKERLVSTAGTQKEVIALMNITKSMGFEGGDDCSVSTSCSTEDDESIEQEVEICIEEPEGAMCGKYYNNNSPLDLDGGSTQQREKQLESQVQSFPTENVPSIPILKSEEKHNLSNNRRQDDIRQHTLYMKGSQTHTIKDENKFPDLVSLDMKRDVDSKKTGKTGIFPLSHYVSDDSDFSLKESFSALSDLVVSPECSPLRGSILFHEESSESGTAYQDLSESAASWNKLDNLMFPMLHHELRQPTIEGQKMQSFDISDPPDMNRSQDFSTTFFHDFTLPVGAADLKNVSMASVSSPASKQSASDTAFSQVMTKTFLFNMENLRRSEEHYDEICRRREEASNSGIVSLCDSSNLSNIEDENSLEGPILSDEAKITQLIDNCDELEIKSDEMSHIESVPIVTSLSSSELHLSIADKKKNIERNKNQSTAQKLQNSLDYDDVLLLREKYSLNQASPIFQEINEFEETNELLDNVFSSISKEIKQISDLNQNKRRENKTQAIQRRTDKGKSETEVTSHISKMKERRKCFSNDLFKEGQYAINSTKLKGEQQECIISVNTKPLSLLEQLDINMSSQVLSFLDIPSIFHISLTSRTMFVASESDMLWKDIFKDRWNTITDKIFSDSHGILDKETNLDTNSHKNLWKLWYFKFASSKLSQFARTSPPYMEEGIQKKSRPLFCEFESPLLESGAINYGCKSDKKVSPKLCRTKIPKLESTLTSNLSSHTNLVDLSTSKEIGNHISEACKDKKIVFKNDYKAIGSDEEHQVDEENPLLQVTPNEIEVIYDEKAKNLKRVKNDERFIDDDDVAFLTNYMYCSRHNREAIFSEPLNDSDEHYNYVEHTNKSRLCGFGKTLNNNACTGGGECLGFNLLFCIPTQDIERNNRKHERDKYVSISGDFSPPSDSSWIERFLDWFIEPEEKEKQFENFNAPSLKLKNNQNLKQIFD